MKKLIFLFALVIACSFTAVAQTKDFDVVVRDANTITIRLKTAKKAALIDDFCAYHNYSDTVTVDGVTSPNPQSKEEFFAEKLQDYINQVVSSASNNKAIKVTLEAEKAKLEARLPKAEKP